MKNLKKDRVYFVNEIEKILLKYGNLLKKRECYNQFHKYFEIPLKNNRLEITLEQEEDQTLVYSVFMCFDVPRKDLGNPYSGKHNFHVIGDVKNAVERFKKFLNEAIKE